MDWVTLYGDSVIGFFWLLLGAAACLGVDHLKDARR